MGSLGGQGSGLQAGASARSAIRFFARPARRSLRVDAIVVGRDAAAAGAPRSPRSRRRSLGRSSVARRDERRAPELRDERIRPCRGAACGRRLGDGRDGGRVPRRKPGKIRVSRFVDWPCVGSPTSSGSNPEGSRSVDATGFRRSSSTERRRSSPCRSRTTVASSPSRWRRADAGEALCGESPERERARIRATAARDGTAQE